MRRTIFLLFVFLLAVVTSPVFAASPYIVCSDATDGPTTGWDGSASKGAAITIWGLNFGSSGTITVGGQTLSSSDSNQVAEWAATTNPTTARGLQRITFWLNSSMSTTGTAPNTTIKVTVGGVDSNTISFHCRALGTSRILFVNPGSGNNSTARTSVSIASPWLTLGKVRSTAEAGDMVYVRSGTTHTAEDAWGAMMCFYQTYNNGSQYNSITVTAYPGEAPVIGDPSVNHNHFVNPDTSAGKTAFDYWTFSKLTINVYDRVLRCQNTGGNSSQTGSRWIGNSIHSYFGGATNGIGFPINPYGNLTNFSILANYFHDCGKGLGGAEEGTSKYAIYIGGGYTGSGVASTSNYIYIGWNEFYNGSGRAIDVYGHVSYDSLDNLYVFNNLIHENGANGVVIGGGDPTPGPNYSFVENCYFYGNILYNNGLINKFSDGDSPGSHGGNFYIYNNSFYHSPNGTYSGNFIIAYPDVLYMRNNAIYSNDTFGYLDNYGLACTTCYGDHNAWYGNGNGPTWSSSDLDNTNPLFSNPATGDFTLQSSSTLIDAGVDVSSVVNRDYYGVLWSGAYDIGAIQYGSEGDTAASTTSGVTLSGCSIH